MRKLSSTFFIIGIILLVYGYLSRILNMYFFWESKTIGWIVLFVALLIFLFELRVMKKRRGQKITWVTIGICFLMFGLLILPGVIFMLKTSDAYQSTIEYLKSDPAVKADIGSIKGFGLIPTGSFQSTTINGSESGVATFNIVVRGDRKYRDVTVNLRKTSDTFWTVTSIE